MMQSSAQSGEKKKRVKTKVKEAVKMHTLLMTNSQLGK